MPSIFVDDDGNCDFVCPDSSDESEEETSADMPSTKGNDGHKVDGKPQATENTAKVQEYAPAGMKCGIRNLYKSKPDKRGQTSWTTTYPDDLDDPPENAESEQYSLVIRHNKCYDGRKKLSILSIIVQSPLLKKVLGKVFDGYPGITTTLLRLEFSAPFQPFVHRWEKFAELKQNETDAETKQHIELLWNALEEELRDTIAEKMDLLANGVTTYSAMWQIFEPGTLVYHSLDGIDRVFILEKGQYTGDPCPGFEMIVKSIDFDGQEFGYSKSTLKNFPFQGTLPITQLAAYPLAHHENVDEVRTKLVARGRHFEGYKGYHFKAYEGVAHSMGPWGLVRHSVNSRIIIDTHAWNCFNPNQKVSVSHIDLKEVVDKDDDDATDSAKIRVRKPTSSRLTKDQLLICTDTLRGYSLKDKKWMRFTIPCVREIVWNEHAFSSLVAPPEQKELILAFAQTQALNCDKFDDVIEGKGKGIIMQLSGPPGVGKTLTAESVAEAMKVPLYMMSSGDLGTNPSAVEQTLGNVLQMNTKWNAVLLLDEADVFLESRSTHDLERNKLVSISLRLLEYFEGILFLTTNRVDNIDAAFESRIHLSLQYEELDAASRRHVWVNFLARSANAQVFSEEQLDKLAEKQLNGRQIKNVLKTAQLLATNKEENLAFAHVEVVLKLRQTHADKKGYSIGGL